MKLYLVSCYGYRHSIWDSKTKAKEMAREIARQEWTPNSDWTLKEFVNEVTDVEECYLNKEIP